MSDDTSIETEATELLRTMIRNACVNDGTPTSGGEDRNADALEAYFAGSGLRCERYAAGPGRVSLITRIEGRDPKAPTLLLMGHTDVVPANASGWERDPFGGDVRGRRRLGTRRHRHAEHHVDDGRRDASPREERLHAARHADLPRGRGRGGGRHVRRELSHARPVRRGEGRLRDHRERRRADPDALGREAARDGRREGRQLAPPGREGDAGPRLDAVAHGQRAGDGGRSRAPRRRPISRRRASSTSGGATCRSSSWRPSSRRRSPIRTACWTPCAISSRSASRGSRTPARTPRSRPTSSRAARRST